jgi:hypothetical protein
LQQERYLNSLAEVVHFRQPILSEMFLLRELVEQFHEQMPDETFLAS